MQLTPREKDKLLIAMAAMVARRRLERGLRLNYPEAVALIADAVVEGARDGRSVAELMEAGAHVLTADQVMEGVPDMIHDIQVEATFPDGTKLVTVHHPIRGAASAEVPGEVATEAGEIVLNEGRETVTLTVANTGDRPIQVGSHYHFFETNPALSFERERARGFRLDIPAGTAVRFEPGQTREVRLVALSGKREVYGFRGEVMGSLISIDWEKRVASALEHIRQDRWAYSAEAYLEVIDDIVMGELGLDELASKHPNKNPNGKPNDRVESALARVTTAIHGTGNVPALENGGWYGRRLGKYVVASGFSEAWKAERGIK